MSHDRESEIGRRLRALSKEGLEPGRDLWGGVERRIREHQARRQRWARGLAAAAVVVVMLGTAWTVDRVRSRSLAAPPSIALPSRTAPAGGSPDVQRAFLEYQELRHHLGRELARELAGRPEELRREIEESLAIIDAAMQRLEESLATLPQDPKAELELVALYRRELRLLDHLDARLGGQGMVRNR